MLNDMQSKIVKGAQVAHERCSLLDVGDIAYAAGVSQSTPCEVCGDEDSQAHHDDYARKLDVLWLCQRHHAERDAERRKA